MRVQLLPSGPRRMPGIRRLSQAALFALHRRARSCWLPDSASRKRGHGFRALEGRRHAMHATKTDVSKDVLAFVTGQEAVRPFL